jgi:hypothetical protein
MTIFEGSPLGKATDYPDRYDASLLFGVSRAPQRAALGIVTAMNVIANKAWAGIVESRLGLELRTKLVDVSHVNALVRRPSHREIRTGGREPSQRRTHPRRGLAAEHDTHGVTSSSRLITRLGATAPARISTWHGRNRQSDQQSIRPSFPTSTWRCIPTDESPA